MSFSCAVLAGGLSRRMGRDKALVEFEGRPLVVHMVERLSSWSDDVFVVSKTNPLPDDPRLRVYDDACDVQAPLAGVLAALRAASHPLVFVCATDMPFVSHEVVELLVSRADAADAVVPRRVGRLEPLHAVWSRSAAGPIAAQMDAGERAVHRALGLLNVVTVDEDEWRRVDPDGVSFTNLNTPDELAAARR
jgi:molybdopterin-guanine dinucleotide biosynthesis protein A